MKFSGETAVMRRFQFSLRKLLLVIAAVVVVASHGLTSYRLRNAERELRDLRVRHGILVVDDTSNIHVQYVDLQQPMTWRWRVYLPPGREYHARRHYGFMQLDGFPNESNFGGFLREGENTITAKVQRDERGAWRVLVYTDSDSGRDSFTIPTESANWLEELFERSYFESVVHADTFDADAPVELLRVAADVPSDDSTKGSSDRYEGILVWIEAQKSTR